MYIDDLLIISLQLAIWSAVLGAGTQYLLSKTDYRRIRHVYEKKMEAEPTASLSTLILHYIIIWLVVYLFLSYSTFHLYSDLYDVVRIPATVLIIDFANYAFHRSMHHKMLYSRFHSLHHSNHNPQSWTDSTLTDLGDWIVSSLIFICPLMLLGATPGVLLSLTWVTVQVQLNHSGYLLPKLPFVISSLEHTYHHWYYDCNYSELTTIPDMIFGTYRAELAI